MTAAAIKERRLRRPIFGIEKVFNLGREILFRDKISWDVRNVRNIGCTLTLWNFYREKLTLLISKAQYRPVLQNVKKFICRKPFRLKKGTVFFVNWFGNTKWKLWVYNNELEKTQLEPTIHLHCFQHEKFPQQFLEILLLDQTPYLATLNSHANTQLELHPVQRPM